MPLTEDQLNARFREIRNALKIMGRNEKFMSQISAGCRADQKSTLHQVLYLDYERALEIAKYDRVTDAGQAPKATTYGPRRQVLDLWNDSKLAHLLLKENPELLKALTAEVGLKQWPFIERVTPKLLSQTLSEWEIGHLFVCEEAAEMVAEQFRFASCEIHRQYRSNSKSGGIIGLVISLVRAKNSQDMVLAWERFLKSQNQHFGEATEPIEKLDLPKNIVACLKGAGIYSNISLKSKSDIELLEIDGIGPKTIARIKKEALKL